jgi:hypothetical protein
MLFTSTTASVVLAAWFSVNWMVLMREFLAVEYEGGGQFYVPVHQADRLTRYVGAEGAVPALDRLGGQEWQEKKGRVKQAVIEVAQEMLDLYARRNVVQGYSFKPDTTWQKELEDSFPYVETEDQKRALAEIKHDMESSAPWTACCAATWAMAKPSRTARCLQGGHGWQTGRHPGPDDCPGAAALRNIFAEAGCVPRQTWKCCPASGRRVNKLRFCTGCPSARSIL